MTKTTTRTRPTVDLAVLKDVYDDALRRLEEVHEQERQETGAAQTTLAAIGRNAILSWKRDGRRTYTPTPRSPNGAAPKRTPFRFRISDVEYSKAKKRITAAGLSVTQVVEEALTRFAQTGK